MPEDWLIVAIIVGILLIQQETGQLWRLIIVIKSDPREDLRRRKNTTRKKCPLGS